MKIKKIMSVMLSMLCSATLTLPSLAVPATAEGNVIIEETTESESVLSEASTYIYTTDVQTTTSDFETTYTTTPDPGAIEMPTTTAPVVEELDFPFAKPVELQIIFINKDKGKWMKNFSFDLKTTRRIRDEKGRTLESFETTENLNTGDEGCVVYKTDCEMLSKYDEYKFEVIPQIPEGFRITSQYSIIYIYGVDVERNSNVLSNVMEFNLTEKEDPFANSVDPFGTGIYGTTTTTAYATTTTTTTTYDITTYTTTPDPGAIEMPTTTTAVIEDLDFPFAKPVELKIIFVNKDKGEWMKNVSLDLKTTRKVYDEKGKTIDSIVTTEKLNTGDEGFVLYKTNCEMLSKYEEYSFIATPEIPEGFRITSQYSIIYINGVEIERNSNVLSKVMEFNLTEKEDPFANTGDPFITGIYGTTTTTTYATTTTTTTTTSTNTTTTTTTISTDTVTTTEIKTEPAFEKCDFNSDGLINGEDVYLLAQRYMEEMSDTEIIAQSSREKIEIGGDLNADNLINMADARLLIDYISENNIIGDVNCDGVLDSRDASDILSYYVNDRNEQSTGIDYGVIALGDYDRNGVVDARDASAVLTYYVTSDNK